MSEREDEREEILSFNREISQVQSRMGPEVRVECQFNLTGGNRENGERSPALFSLFPPVGTLKKTKLRLAFVLFGAGNGFAEVGCKSFRSGSSPLCRAGGGRVFFQRPAPDLAKLGSPLEAPCFPAPEAGQAAAGFGSGPLVVLLGPDL